MITLVAAVGVTAGIVILIAQFRLLGQAQQIASASTASLRVLTDPDIDDDVKEKALQRQSLLLLLRGCLFFASAAVAFLLPVGMVWLVDHLGSLSFFDDMLALMLSVPFLVGTTLLLVAGVALWPRRAGDGTRGISQRYSVGDQALHYLAFGSYRLQARLARYEDRALASKLQSLQAERPLFITALPRAGTTVLLEMLASLPEFAAHTYRDMPFVLIPYWWHRVSRRLRKSGEKIERAHGDGMMIDFDSHEALEEILWHTFWPERYQRDRIDPWPPDYDSAFWHFLQNHMRKIIYLRRGAGACETRYVSKNNLNIARIPMILKHLPDATIIVPFREPLHHASSLLEQQRNFLRLQAEDSFSKDYMRALGHFDFGANLRPVNFDNWFGRPCHSSSEELAFWLEYWIACYRYLLHSAAGRVLFLSYDDLCRAPEPGLVALAAALKLRDASALVEQARMLRAPRAREIDAGGISESLLQSAMTLYAALRETSVTYGSCAGESGETINISKTISF